MGDSKLRELGRRVRDEPGNPEVLRGLARLAARAERLPEEATPGRVLPALAKHWREDPEDRTLEALFLALVGAEVPDGDAPHVPPWFGLRSRARVLEGRAFDLRQGFPLRLHRRVDGGVMVLVPDGVAIRGTDDLGPECGPPHQISLEAFYLDRRSVTWRQYLRFLETQGGRAALPSSGNLDHPVTGIPWEQAAAYCAWAGGRLPTEAEYEKAMRGPLGWRYPWGDQRLVAVSPDDAVSSVADRLADQPELQRSPVGRLVGEVIRQGARRAGQGESTRMEDPEFGEESPYGLLGVDAARYDWTDDWYHQDAYRDAVRRCPRPPAPPAPRGPVMTNQEWAEARYTEHLNRYEDGDDAYADRIYREALRDGPPWMRTQGAKVVRRGSPELGPGRYRRRHGRWHSCAERAHQRHDTGRNDIGFRVAFSAARAPEAFPPPGTKPAKVARRKTPAEPERRERPRPRKRAARGERNPFAELTNIVLDAVDELREDE
jgi:formylglycine-generating enzyme required for sulfatase activity